MSVLFAYQSAALSAAACATLVFDCAGGSLTAKPAAVSDVRQARHLQDLRGPIRVLSSSRCPKRPTKRCESSRPKASGGRLSSRSLRQPGSLPGIEGLPNGTPSALCCTYQDTSPLLRETLTSCTSLHATS